MPNYVSSFDVIEHGAVEIVLVEYFPCKTKEELTARERYWIQNNDCINKSLKYTERELQDKKNESKRQKYICECGKVLTRGNKARHEKNYCKLTSAI